MVLELVCGRPTLALGAALVHQKNYEKHLQNESNTIEKQSGQLELKDR